MPKYKPGGCKCRQKRYISNGIHEHSDCLDVCVNPICGDPDNLTLLAPVVYDELGINLCRSIPITLPENACTVTGATVQVTDVQFGRAPENTNVAQIPGRPNCYLVTLTDLLVSFIVTFFDCSKRVVYTEAVTATYLPFDSSSPGYQYFDEETNPNSVELEIFAPYGTAHADAAGTEPILQTVGFTPDNNTLQQGLNLIAIPKILNLDLAESTLTVGLSVYIKSIYFSQYQVPHNGRAVVPKASLQPTEDTICMDFVSGDLLDLSIKPLELGPPKCEEFLKEACEEHGCGCGCDCGCSRMEHEADAMSVPDDPLDMEISAQNQEPEA